MAMNKDSAAGPDRAGERWILLVATNDYRNIPDYSVSQRLGLMVHNITAGEYTEHVSHLRSAENLIPL